MGQTVCKACGLPSLKQPNEDVLKFLAQVQLFKQLPKELHPSLAAISQKVEFHPGEMIIRQGDAGDAFFVIMDGEARVIIDGQEAAQLKAYDYFGERALLNSEPRAATITAKTQVVAVKIQRDHFQTFNLHERLRFAHRKAVGGGAAQAKEAQPPSPKTPEERKLMAKAIRDNHNLRAVLHLDDNHVNQMIDGAWKETVAAGTELIQEGDLSADYFYIVQEGRFDIFVRDHGGTRIEDVLERAQNVGSVQPGGSFGELALLHQAPRAATVKAVVPALVWVIDRTKFKEILAKSADDIAMEHVRHLDHVEILASLQQGEKQELARAMTEMIFSKGETIFKQGEKGEIFYILIEGEVAVIKDGHEEARLTATPAQASLFGERALLKSEPRNATIKVVSESAKALTLDRDSFNMLLGPLEELQRRGKLGKTVLGPGRPVLAAPAGAAKPTRAFGLVKKKDLRRLGLLGCGGFGAVDLVEHTVSSETYALKMLSKGYVVKAGMQQSIMSEKNVQLMCDSPFIVKLVETYNTDQSLWFLLEPALGGELYATYSRRGLHGKESHALFYVAGVVFAFEHLHGLKVIYRDLKPENLLLTDEGRVKLTDMGLAKVVLGKTYTTCGTPDYFAPEMVASTGHTHAVDWWTLGILSYELMSGHPPFEAPTPMQTYQKVTAGILKVTFPAPCRGVLQDLIQNLCHKNPSKRLPMKSGGIENIKTHAWFQTFQWDAMQSGSLQPPYVPAVTDKRDLKNFTARPEDLPPQVPYKDDGTGWDKDFATST